MSEFIKEIIKQKGHITVAEFMQLALAHLEHGYYSAGERQIGAEGDFITAPEISQMFGEIVGVYFANLWQQMNKPEKIQLVELGGGRGTLMFDILNATKNIEGFHQALELHIVDISKNLRAQQIKKLSIFSNIKLNHHNNFNEIPPGNMLLIANEFFDSLPIEQYQMQNGKWFLRMVNLDEKGNLQFALGKEIALKEEGKFRDGDIIEQSPISLKLIAEIAERLKANVGSALIIDYGYQKRDQAVSSLQALRQHKYHNIFKQIGEVDLTAHVDFAALENIAKKAGRETRIINQGEFLLDFGIIKRAEILSQNANDKQRADIASALYRLTHRSEMGELFKCLLVV